MKYSRVCILIGLVFAAVSFVEHPRMHAQDLTVFVSAFTSGEEGAVHAFDLQLETGPANRSTGQPMRNSRSSWPYRPTADSSFPSMLRASLADRNMSRWRPMRWREPTGGLKLLNRQSTRPAPPPATWTSTRPAGRWFWPTT